MRIALDTNLLVYAENVAITAADAHKPPIAIRLLDQIFPPENIVLPAQVLGELHSVLTRKARWSRTKARNAVLAWATLYPPMDTTATAMIAATGLAEDHNLSIWDSLVLAVAAEAGCGLVLSEDMNDGFEWRGLTVVNPFADHPHPRLAAEIAGCVP